MRIQATTPLATRTPKAAGSTAPDKGSDDLYAGHAATDIIWYSAGRPVTYADHQEQLKAFALQDAKAALNRPHERHQEIWELARNTVGCGAVFGAIGSAVGGTFGSATASIVGAALGGLAGVALGVVGTYN